ncbi:Predicted arabinose efflux permease, MFS family [Blastococcus aggregatus]|uniref:Predicted arabinose efflux permease, MFS family n=1 Tax=Blastococcus aggregatus TaxID=38502 RepID=A0A285VDG9_9ACTN|nr:MFS transporter [Blastococcus aggregatus]SOC51997.1 Predicted arabinose efflux permease, MFS family [Blastococcus aggregatus]
MSPRTVFDPYLRLFAVPGSRAFAFAGWVARLPAPMLGLGAVLLVEEASGSYGLAGAVSGTLALSFAVAGPQWARAMDRRGQGAVLRLAMVSLAVTGVAFALAVQLDAPRWSWFLLAALTGGSAPNVGSMVRARWSAALDSSGRQTAFAFEAVVDEVVFVLGPPLVTLLATLVAPPVGFLTGILLGVVGGFSLAAQRDTEPPLHPQERSATGRRRSVVTPTLLVVALTYLAVGTVFGAIDVVVIGFAEAEGAKALSGLALAVFAGGSLVAGLVYGLARPARSLAARFVGTALAFALAAQLLWAVGSLPMLVLCGFLAGLTIAPVLVSGTSLVESRVGRGVLTESLAWTITGLTLGVTVGSALAGAAVDSWGAQQAFAVPALAAGAAGVLALVSAPLLRERAGVAPATPEERVNSPARG